MTKRFSGEPRSETDLQEALTVVEKTIVMKVPPELGVMLPTIREALIELLERRQERWV